MNLSPLTLIIQTHSMLEAVIFSSKSNSIFKHIKKMSYQQYFLSSLISFHQQSVAELLILQGGTLGLGVQPVMFSTSDCLLTLFCSRKCPVGGHANRPQIIAGLHVELFQLGQDMFAIGVFAQGGHMGTDLVHEDLALRWVSHIYHLLDHVVGKLVLHHGVNGTVGPVGGANTLDIGQHSR